MISPPRRVKCSFQSSSRGFRLGEHPPGLGLKNPNQGVSGSRPVTAEPPVEREEESLAAR